MSSNLCSLFHLSRFEKGISFILQLHRIFDSHFVGLDSPRRSKRYPGNLSFEYGDGIREAPSVQKWSYEHAALLTRYLVSALPISNWNYLFIESTEYAPKLLTVI